MHRLHALAYTALELFEFRMTIPNSQLATPNFKAVPISLEIGSGSWELLSQSVPRSPNSSARARNEAIRLAMC